VAVSAGLVPLRLAPTPRAFGGGTAELTITVGRKPALDYSPTAGVVPHAGSARLRVAFLAGVDELDQTALAVMPPPMAPISFRATRPGSRRCSGFPAILSLGVPARRHCLFFGDKASEKSETRRAQALDRASASTCRVDLEPVL